MSDTWVLLNGTSVEVEMPDLYGILATVGQVPSQIMIDVLNLLDADGVELPGADPRQKFLRIRNDIRGKYALASLLLVRPRLALGREPGEGEIGPRALGFGDVEALYRAYFRGGYRPPPLVAAPPADPVGAQEPAPGGGDVRAEAE